jgi:hypothetical protein
MRTTDLGMRFKLDDSFICAGGNSNVDTCKGDGGGPLMCRVANDVESYVQVGIVAWGKGCGQEGIPGVYASIADAYCFINWATSCYNDHAEAVPPQCVGWLDNEIKVLDAKKEEYTAALALVTRKIDGLRLNARLDKVNYYANKIYAAIDSCDSAIAEREENLGGYARIGGDEE